jgi:hypothetical protein
MSLSTNFPTIRPTLLLDFANSGTVDPRITFTRASTATYFNQHGVLQSAAADQPRFDYDPSTLAAQGLLIEESRTNSIRNNTMQGAVAGTPGTDPTNWVNSIPAGITQQLVGTGTENGITYIDYRFSGTATGAIVIRPDSESQVVASSGQAWTGTSYVKLISGSLTNVGCRLNMRQGLAAGTLVSQTDVVFTPTTAALNTQRFINSVASMDPTTERIMVRVVLDATGAIDITLRIGLPQLEQSAFATSVIPTTTTALTRNADLATMTGTNFSSWYNASEGTLYYEGMVQANNDGIVYTGIGNTFDNTAYFVRAAPNQTWIVRSGASAQAAVDVVFTPTANVPFKMVGTLKVNDFAFCVNGGTVATDVSGAVPASAVRLGIGNSPWAASGGNARQQWIRSIRYYPVRVTNAQLQALTG